MARWWMGKLVLLIWLMWSGFVAAVNSRDKAWRQKKSSCEKTTCAHLVPEEAYNCVNQCTSPKCYSETYAENPLEDGEIDGERSKLFVACLRDEAREEKRRKLEGGSRASAS